MPDCLAERGGFEPPVRYHRTLAFQASTLNHSATSPFYLPGALRGGIDSGLRPSPVKRALAHFVHCASSRPASPTSARTPGTVSPYTRFPGEHLKPLSHLSVFLIPLAITAAVNPGTAILSAALASDWLPVPASPGTAAACPDPPEFSVARFPPLPGRAAGRRRSGQPRRHMQTARPGKGAGL